MPETSEIEVTAGSKVDTTEDETKDSKEPESSKNSSNQGDLLRSIVNWSGAALSVPYVCKTGIINISVTLFLYFNLKKINVLQTILAIFH